MRGKVAESKAVHVRVRSHRPHRIAIDSETESPTSSWNGASRIPNQAPLRPI
jgi:hypothetical protein